MSAEWRCLNCFQLRAVTLSEPLSECDVDTDDGRRLVQDELLAVHGAVEAVKKLSKDPLCQ